MVTLDDFTVGWICGLETGLVTAISLLDETYESPPTPLDDDNTYVFGRIAQHQVCITCIPTGLYGASVASRLLRTFRNLEFALLVGIGSGAPSRNHDIRLGDVVVSQPGRDHRGVIQYDLGKRTAIGPLASTRPALSKPTVELLSALVKLQAQHLIYKPMYMDYFSALSATDIGLEHPGVQYDNLYESACVHRLDHDDCSHCDQIVDRPPRESTAPQVHYGLIASSDQVLKNANVRDQLSQKLGVLCFSMETAGLMDHLPCLVITGIADYADSHKNKRWQRYAATAAAAYAKELLHYVHPDALGISEGANADNGSTSSATLVTDSDNELVNKAAAIFAAAFLSDKKLKSLCTACIPRMTASRFQRSIIEILSHYGANMKKSTDTPLGQSVAFITKHRKEFISYIIRERIFPSRTESAERKLGVMSEQEVKRLKQLIESRFPSHQYDDAHKARPSKTEFELKETDADPETDITDMPVSLTETDLENITDIVCTGEPYWEAYKELELVAFPDPAQELKRDLQTHIPENGSQYVINCMVQ
ncbi:nucleoside phosphorylase domain-containing protein [Aspergillus filifer]